MPGKPLFTLWCASQGGETPPVHVILLVLFLLFSIFRPQFCFYLVGGVSLVGVTLCRVADAVLRFLRWPIGVTHIVEPQLSRSMKTLAGLACGAWVVSTAFVAACQASCGLVEAVGYLLESFLLPYLFHYACIFAFNGYLAGGWAPQKAFSRSKGGSWGLSVALHCSSLWVSRW